MYTREMRRWRKDQAIHFSEYQSYLGEHYDSDTIAVYGQFTCIAIQMPKVQSPTGITRYIFEKQSSVGYK